MSGEKKGIIAAITAYIIFGLSYLFSKMALAITDPIMLLFARFTLTFILLNLLVATRLLKLNLKGKKLAGPILLGILQPVLYFVLENYGIKYTTTSFTGMIAAISPVFTAIMGAIFLRERPNAKQWLGIIISIAGVMMVSVKSTGGENTVLGCICLLAAYFLGSFYSLLVRRLTKEFTPFEVTYIMFTVGFVFFGGMAFVQNGANTLPIMGHALAQPEYIISVLFLGGLSSVVAYLLANYSLSKLPVAQSTIFSSITTIVSVLAGVIVMGDKFTVINLISFILILVGVWAVNHFAERA